MWHQQVWDARSHIIWVQSIQQELNFLFLLPPFILPFFWVQLKAPLLQQGYRSTKMEGGDYFLKHSQNFTILLSKHLF
jgi:hypothetical protein